MSAGSSGAGWEGRPARGLPDGGGGGLVPYPAGLPEGRQGVQDEPGQQAGGLVGAPIPLHPRELLQPPPDGLDLVGVREGPPAVGEKRPRRSLRAAPEHPSELHRGTAVVFTAK